MLKVKFKKLHSTVVDINAANIIDFLFQEAVISDEDMRKLQVPADARQQCRNLLTLLHTSDHPHAFVQLYRAIRNEPGLERLADSVDELRHPSVTNVLQRQRYLGDPAGKSITSPR